MPSNKLAALRHRIINRLLVNRKKVTKQEMREAIQEALDLPHIGLRTIDKDIEEMRYNRQLGFFAPIEVDRSDNTYFYSDPNYSIDKMPLNVAELKSMAFVGSLLEQFRDVDIFETYRDAVEKIVNAINIRRLQQDRPAFSFIGFEQTPVEHGLSFLSPLVGAIADKKVVEVEYRRFDRDYALIHRIHPYYLKEYRNRWYLLGFLEKIGEITTLALDRIVSVNLLENVAYRPSDFDPDAYFRNSIGIIARSGPPVEVKLRFRHFQGNYLLTQPLHASQEVYKETKNYLFIRMKVAITYELISVILGWGKDVKVVGPAGLKELIRNEAEEMRELYS